jgi:hypothetical protein
MSVSNIKDFGDVELEFWIFLAVERLKGNKTWGSSKSLLD